MVEYSKCTVLQEQQNTDDKTYAEILIAKNLFFSAYCRIFKTLKNLGSIDLSNERMWFRFESPVKATVSNPRLRSIEYLLDLSLLLS